MNRETYVCLLSYNQAMELGMEEAYWESYRRNEECAKAVTRAIDENYDGRSLKDGCAEEAISRFGLDRVSFVLAYNIRHLSYDGRISRENRIWAEGMGSPSDSGLKLEWLIQSHPGLLDIFAGIVKKQQEMGSPEEEALPELDGEGLEDGFTNEGMKMDL